MCCFFVLSFYFPQDLESICPACGLSFLLKKRSVKAVTLINKKARGTNRNRNVSDEHFSDELLRTSCDRCSTILRLAPFISTFPTRQNFGLSSMTGTSKLEMVSSDDEDDEEARDDKEPGRGAVFGAIHRTRHKKKFEFSIVSFVRTKPEEYTGNEHKSHQKKLKIKMRAHESTRGKRKGSVSRPNTRSDNADFSHGLAGSAITDSITIGEGESAFDILNLSTHRPETPPPRMRMSVSKMSLVHEKGSSILPAPRTLPKVYGTSRGGHLSRTRVVTKFNGIDILKL